jgi:hypothetical protein
MLDSEFGGLVLFGVIVALILTFMFTLMYCTCIVLRVACRKEPLAQTENSV